MVLNLILGSLALLSLALTFWQWIVARHFRLHQRISDNPDTPAVTALKPLKGLETETEECLRSWFKQTYDGPIQLLFGVANAEDPVCATVQQLILDHPDCDARLVVCGQSAGANAKVSTLIQLQPLIRHEIIVVSDADVRVPPDLMANVVPPLSDPSVGLVNCFYRLANPTTLAMRWEAIAINADFWSQVLQSQSLRPLDFALGAVMVTRRKELEAIAGFQALADDLADDYQLGRLIAGRKKRIVLSTVVVDCWSDPMDWRQVWSHQLRWARTIRICRPIPYFFSILSNATIWPLIWILTQPSFLSLNVAAGCLLVRLATATNNYRRMSHSLAQPASLWLVPIKDLLQAAIWAFAFLGSRVQWRAQTYRVRPDGKLKPIDGRPE
ncbi:MAG: ceramide glucosyltransferase [Verrucomicrobiota bacterium]